MKNTENAERPISAIEYTHFSPGPCRRSGRPVQTSRRSVIRLSSALTPPSNHELHLNTSSISSILRDSPTISTTCGRLDSPDTSSHAHLRMRLVCIENRCRRSYGLEKSGFVCHAKTQMNGGLP